MATRPDVATLRRLYLDEQLTLQQVGDHIGYSASGVAKLLRTAGVPRRPAGTPQGDRRIDHDQDVMDDIVARYQAGASLQTIAKAYDRSSWWVRSRLQRAGQTTRRRGAPGAVTATKEQLTEMRRLYLDEGLTLAGVGERPGHSGTWVSRELKAAGVSVRNGGTVRIDVDDDQIRRMYVDEQMSSTAIGERLGISANTVLVALHRLGVELRPSGTGRLPYTRDELRRLYVEEGRSTAEIATREAVATWAVTRRLRADGIHRPPATPPGTRPSPPAADLQDLYLEQGLSQAEIATRFQVPRNTVRRWLDNADIQRRPSGGTGRTPGRPTALDRDEVEELYMGSELTAAEVGRRLGVTKKVILTALHQHGIPVRPSGPRRREARILLDDLHSDDQIVAVLEAHRIPLRQEPGPLRIRWPAPAHLTPTLLDQLYTSIGLSAQHISLLAGHHESRLLVALQEAGIPTRPDRDRSPWSTRRT